MQMSMAQLGAGLLFFQGKAYCEAYAPSRLISLEIRQASSSVHVRLPSCRTCAPHKCRNACPASDQCNPRVFLRSMLWLVLKV